MMAKKKIWTFTVLCWECLRIFDLPAGLFLQGDPVCECGSKYICANWIAREFMSDLVRWSNSKRLYTLITSDYRTVVQWSKSNGAVFEEAKQLTLL